MYIAEQLKKKSVAEYLLYMWQIEDLIRAAQFNIDIIDKNILGSKLSDDERKAMLKWYGELIDMMRRENVTQKGHIQINKNVIIWLSDLHARLLQSPKFTYYKDAYYKTLPLIVELRAKGADKDEPEIETCFEGLYGILMLKVKGKEISDATLKAQSIIADFLAMLSDYYRQEKAGELSFD